MTILIIVYVIDIYMIYLCSLQGFGRRRELMAKPLLQEEGIASLILENPFCILLKHYFVV
jgi:hypothetical protein